ncbi:hypothetical protein J2Y48_004962 [Mycoplana sp. BE70]|uniref:BA14K family protein n=1 Tax=Mycoplana sp. BE70 TaxID=2817775 RepID=UPI00285B3303|nr:BA14K family protein [Mycoplana sp. BE70]MDR6759644.1 hypothetical protein [Mycoplana sp. BE70]
MGKIVTGLMAAVLSAATLATAFVPVQASAMPRAGATVPTDVENVDYYVRRGYRDGPRYSGGGRYYRGGGDRYYRGGGGYYRGYRGYPYYREGYRRYDDGYWYPLAAFTAGALIGGAIASQPRYYDGGVNPRHFDWCAGRYRSYRAYDNTFQPYYGPRQQCQSPYY